MTSYQTLSLIPLYKTPHLTRMIMDDYSQSDIVYCNSAYIKVPVNANNNLLQKKACSPQWTLARSLARLSPFRQVERLSIPGWPPADDHRGRGLDLGGEQNTHGGF